MTQKFHSIGSLFILTTFLILLLRYLTIPCLLIVYNQEGVFDHSVSQFVESAMPPNDGGFFFENSDGYISEYQAKPIRCEKATVWCLAAENDVGGMPVANLMWVANGRGYAGILVSFFRGNPVPAASLPPGVELLTGPDMGVSNQNTFPETLTIESGKPHVSDIPNTVGIQFAPGSYLILLTPNGVPLSQMDNG